MANLLTKQNLRKIYACYAKLPPFNEYRMPAPHKVTFQIINDADTFGWFINDPARIQISKTLCTNWDLISQTMLHEMIHCMLWYNYHNDFDQHKDKFNKFALRVCDIYKFNIEDF